MENFKRVNAGQITPWGKAQSAEEYPNGIRLYGTPGHGGFFVKKALRAKMPVGLVNHNGWYEEDCEALKVMKAFPELFDRTPEEIEKSFNYWFNADGTYKERA